MTLTLRRTSAIERSDELVKSYTMRVTRTLQQNILFSASTRLSDFISDIMTYVLVSASFLVSVIFAVGYSIPYITDAGVSDTFSSLTILMAMTLALTRLLPQARNNISVVSGMNGDGRTLVKLKGLWSVLLSSMLIGFALYTPLHTFGAVILAFAVFILIQSAAMTGFIPRPLESVFVLSVPLLIPFVELFTLIGLLIVFAILHITVLLLLLIVVSPAFLYVTLVQTRVIFSVLEEQYQS